MNYLVIGDCHGSPEALVKLMRTAGALYPDAQWDDEGLVQGRLPNWHVIQLGDLANLAPYGKPCRGFYSKDLEILRLADEGLIDELLVGNHEFAYAWTSIDSQCPLVGPGQWDGMAVPFELEPGVTETINRLVRKGQYRIAAAAHNTLITHAGLHPGLWHGMPDNAEGTAEWLNMWLEGLALGESEMPNTPRQQYLNPILNTNQGVLWLRPSGSKKWKRPMSFEQIVGHHSKPDHHPRYVKSRKTWYIDNGGYALNGDSIAGLMWREHDHDWTVVRG